MTKQELDSEIGKYYSALLSVARKNCYKKKRSYAPEELLSLLYCHLEGRIEGIDIFGFYGYCSTWIRNQINWDRSELNLSQMKLLKFYDKEVGGIDPRGEGSAVDILKEKLNEVKGGIKNKVNLIFIEEVAGEKEYNRETIAKLYDITPRAVDQVVKNIRREIVTK